MERPSETQTMNLESDANTDKDVDRGLGLNAEEAVINGLIFWEKFAVGELAKQSALESGAVLAVLEQMPVATLRYCTVQ